MFAAKGALFKAAAEAEARARQAADEVAALRRALDVEQRERAAQAELAAAYPLAERSRLDLEEEARRLRGEVERLGGRLVEAEEGSEALAAQARKAREEAGALRVENSGLALKVAGLEGGLSVEAEVTAQLQKQLRLAQEGSDRQALAAAAADAEVQGLRAELLAARGDVDKAAAQLVAAVADVDTLTEQVRPSLVHTRPPTLSSHPHSSTHIPLSSTLIHPHPRPEAAQDARRADGRRYRERPCGGAADGRRERPRRGGGRGGAPAGARLSLSALSSALSSPLSILAPAFARLSSALSSALSSPLSSHCLASYLAPP